MAAAWSHPSPRPGCWHVLCPTETGRGHARSAGSGHPEGTWDREAAASQSPATYAARPQSVVHHGSQQVP